MTILSSLFPGSSGSVGPFASIRRVGAWYDSEIDGTTGTLTVPLAPTRVAGDFLMVFLCSTFRGDTAVFPESGYGFTARPAVNDSMIFATRVATGDANDAFGFSTISSTGLHCAQMVCFDTGVRDTNAFLQGGSILTYSSEGSNFPVAGQGAATDNYQLTFHLYQKMNANADVSASSITDNILAGDADAHGTIGTRVMNGQSKSMWMGWTYRVHNTTDKAAVTTGTWQQDETPDGSAGHTVNGFTMTYKFT